MKSSATEVLGKSSSCPTPANRRYFYPGRQFLSVIPGVCRHQACVGGSEGLIRRLHQVLPLFSCAKIVTDLDGEPTNKGGCGSPFSDRWSISFLGTCGCFHAHDACVKHFKPQLLFMFTSPASFPNRQTSRGPLTKGPVVTSSNE